MAKSKALFVKIRIVKMGLTMRILIIISSFFLKINGGFLPSEFRQFMYVMLPLSCFYMILFIRFIVKNAYKYPEQGPADSNGYIQLGYYGLLILNIIEFLLILYRAFYSAPDLPDFILYVAVIESVFGIAGFFISDIFSDTNNSKNHY